MAQIPGLGLDQSQLADVINQQYKGYSQKQRNQMMQSAAATPDNWTSITDQANKTATQPTEFLGAGRTSDIPVVSSGTDVYTSISPEKYQEFKTSMPEFGTGSFSPQYSNDKAYYFNDTGVSNLNQLSGVYDFLKKINPVQTKTVSDTPLTYTSFMDQFGATPTGGWSDANTKNYNTVPKYLDGLRPNPEYSREKPVLQRWQDDASYLPNFSLYGSGSPEDIQRGFNVLQRMSPQNIGEFWGLSPAAQKGMLENPGVALQQMRSLANPANGDWLSIGAEGGFRDINAYNWDAARGLTTDRSQYMTIDDSNSGLLGSLNEVIQKVDPLNSMVEKGVANLLGYDSGLDMVRSIGEPVGNLAGAVFSGGIPWGSIVMGLDNISTGNDKALLGNAIGGLTSYAGANMPTGGINTGYGAAANAAATGAASNALNSFGRGGDLADMFKAAAMGGLGGASGYGVGQLTSNLSPTLSGFLSGAARGATSSLLQPQNMLESALSSGAAGGLGGMFNNGVTNKPNRAQNSQAANNLVKLGKLFVKK